jgi:hypothetical protein
MDAFERRAIFKYHLVGVDAYDFLALCLDQRLVVHFGDKDVALDSPRTRLNNLKLFVADLSAVLIVWGKTFLCGVIGGKDDSAYTFNVPPGPCSNHVALQWGPPLASGHQQTGTEVNHCECS